MRPQHRTAHPVVAILFGIALMAAIAAVVVLLVDRNRTSALRGSGRPAVETRTVAAFHAVDLAGANETTVRVGGPQSITVRADDNVIKYVTTRVRGGTLTIGKSRSFTTGHSVSVDIVVPTLSAVTLSGAGLLEVAGVDVPRFVVRLPGSGLLSVSGRVTTLEATLAGSGNVGLRDLVARDVTVTVSGAGRLEVNAIHRVTATVSGVGEILYTGNPVQVTQHVTGTGSIRSGE